MSNRIFSQSIKSWHRTVLGLLSWSICLLGLVLAIGTAIAEEVPDSPFRVCFEMQNNMPFIHGVPEDGVVELGKHGVLADLLTLAAEQHDIELDFSFMPWKRCIHQLRQGRVDGIIAAIWSVERDSWGVFPLKEGSANSEMAIWFVDYLIFTKAGAELNWDGSSFVGVRHGIAAPLGYIAYKKLSEQGVLHNQNLSLTDGFTLLGLGRLDGYVVEESIGRRVINDLQLTDTVVPIETPFMRVNWFMPVSHQWYKAHPEFSRQFWQTLSDIRNKQGKVLLDHYLEVPSENNH